MNLCSRELRHTRMDCSQVLVGKISFSIPKTQLKWNDYRYIRNIGPENYSEFLVSCFDKMPEEQFGDNVSHACWARVNSLLVWHGLLGVRQESASSRLHQGWLVDALRLSVFCKIIPAGRTGLADLIFVWMSHSCGGSLSIICLHPCNARVIVGSFHGLVKGGALSQPTNVSWSPSTVNH